MRIDRTRTPAPVGPLPTITALPIAACSLNAYCSLLLDRLHRFNLYRGIIQNKNKKEERESPLILCLSSRGCPLNSSIHSPVVSDTLTMEWTAPHTHIHTVTHTHTHTYHIQSVELYFLHRGSSFSSSSPFSPSSRSGSGRPESPKWSEWSLIYQRPKSDTPKVDKCTGTQDPQGLIKALVYFITIICAAGLVVLVLWRENEHSLIHCILYCIYLNVYCFI